jgi:hypothetical protein
MEKAEELVVQKVKACTEAFTTEFTNIVNTFA